MAEPLKDLRINEDRDVEVGDQNDLVLTEGQENIEQSVAITAGDELKRLISKPLTGQTLERIRETLREALSDDPQISTVSQVEIRTIDRVENKITMRVKLIEDPDFTAEVAL